MNLGIVLGVAGALGIATTAWWGARHRSRRDRHYQELSTQEHEVLRRNPIVLSPNLPAPASLAGQFDRDRILRIESFLAPECLAAMLDEALATRTHMERSYIPTHKQGSTLAYEKVILHAPRCWAFYRSPVVADWLSKVTGVPMYSTPMQDQSSLSLLCYEREGDHIQWHYDHNFYSDRHFTVLLSLCNRGAVASESAATTSTVSPSASSPAATTPENGLSRSVFQRQLPGGKVQEFSTAENSLVIFEGARVRHRATPAAEGDLRLILSMTYCADPRNSRLKEFLRRCKDTAFFGIRALWD